MWFSWSVGVCWLLVYYWFAGFAWFGMRFALFGFVFVLVWLIVVWFMGFG